MSLKKKKKLTWYIAIWSNPRDSKESALIDYYQLSKLIFPVPPSQPPPIKIQEMLQHILSTKFN